MSQINQRFAKPLRVLGYFAIAYAVVVAICAFGTWLVYGVPSAGGMPAMIVAVGVALMSSDAPRNFEKLGRFSLIGGLGYVIIYGCMINAGTMS